MNPVVHPHGYTSLVLQVLDKDYRAKWERSMCSGHCVGVARLARSSFVRQIQVTVRGNAPEWTASLIANRLGNAERHAAFSSLVSDLRAEYNLKV
jgi:hypothetical protein